MSIAQISKIDQKFGFRNIKLETTFSDLQKIYRLEEIPYTNKFQVHGLDMYLDNLPIRIVTVEFYKEKLYSIFISIDCQNSGSKVSEMVEQTYGKLKPYHGSYDYHVLGKRCELIYEGRGEYQKNGALNHVVGITIRSTGLKDKLSGKNSGF